VPCKIAGRQATPSRGRGRAEKGHIFEGQDATMVGRSLSNHDHHPG